MNRLRVLRSAALAAQVVTLALLASRGAPGIAAALPLLVTGLYMWRGTLRAYAVNTLLMPFVTGVALAFRVDPVLKALALVSAFGFLATVYYIRTTARLGANR